MRSPPLKPGILMGISSPSSCGERPTKATTTLASLARATASSIWAWAGASHLRVRPPPDWSAEWEYSSLKSCSLVSAKSNSILVGLAKFITGGAVGEAPACAWKLPIVERSSLARRLPSPEHFAVYGEAVALSGRVGKAVANLESEDVVTGCGSGDRAAPANRIVVRVHFGSGLCVFPVGLD